MKRIGPELKMPKLKGGEMKVPPVISDLYLDLRDRRLLPLVALIAIAIVATPMLLGGGSEEPEPVPPPAAVTAGAPASQTLTVVKAEPGLRNYKKRLGRRSPTNPFKQRFNGPRLNGAQLNEPANTTTTTTTTGSTGTTGSGSANRESSSPAPSTGAPTTSTPGGGSTTERLTFYTWGIDVELSKLPSEKVDPEAKPEASW